MKIYDKNGNDVTQSFLYNPNLLINSDFRDFIINQRGKTSYLYTDADTQYTIDRWCATGVNISVGTSGITLKNRSGLSTSKIFQPFENELKAGTYTVTVGCQEALGIYVDINETGSSKQQLSNGVNTFTFTTASTIKGFYFLFDGESTDEGAYWYYAKLEPGSISTPLVSRLYAEELALCQRYFQWFSAYTHLNGYVTNSGKQILIQIPLSCNMYKASTLSSAPKIVIRTVSGYSSQTNGAAAAITPSSYSLQNKIGFIQMTLDFDVEVSAVNNSPVVVTLTEIMQLDAEIY